MNRRNDYHKRCSYAHLTIVLRKTLKIAVLSFKLLHKDLSLRLSTRFFFTHLKVKLLEVKLF